MTRVFLLRYSTICALALVSCPGAFAAGSAAGSTPAAVSFHQSSVPISCALGGPIYLVTGDFNRDHKADLAMICADPTNHNGGTIDMLLGNGDGTFQAPTQIVPNIPNVTYLNLEAIDLNNDGATDLVFVRRITSGSNIITVTDQIIALIANGTGGFKSQLTFEGFGDAFTHVAHDLNGDGIPDAINVVFDFGSLTGSLYVSLGKGDGTFQPAVQIAGTANPHGIGGFLIDDFNGDGKPDILLPKSDANYFLAGKGDGTFLAPIKASAEAGAELSGDFNGDGKLDIAFGVIKNLEDVHVLLGKGDGTFAPSVIAISQTQPSTLFTADLNGDGVADIATYTYSSNPAAVNVFLSKGDGTMQLSTTLSAGANVSFQGVVLPAEGLVMVDLNGDGKPDLVVTDLQTNTVLVYLNTTTFPVRVTAVQNAAAFTTEPPVAGGALIAIFGAGFGPASPVGASSIPLPPTLGGVSVTLNGTPLPLLYVSSTQIDAQVSWTAATGNSNLVVHGNGQLSAPFSVPVGAFSPGIFAVGSQAIASNLDGSLAGPPGSIPGLSMKPAKAGDALVILCTGLGAVDSSIADGANSIDKLRNTTTVPQVLIGGQAAQVLFSGLSPQFVGVNQVNVIVPPLPTAGVVPLQIKVGGITTTNTITVAVEN